MSRMNKSYEQKKAWEKEIFSRFVLASGLAVDAGSVSLPLEDGVPPPPDVRCLIGGKPYFFELAEVVPTEQAEALGTKGMYQIGFPDGKDLGPNAFRTILTKKHSKQYFTEGSPIDLVLYFSKDFPIYIPDIYPKKPRQTEMGKVFRDCLDTGKFSRIWLYDTWTNKILLTPR